MILPEYIIYSPCSTSNTRELRAKARIKIQDIKDSEDLKVVLRTEFFIICEYRGKEYSIYENGKIILKDAEDKKELIDMLKVLVGGGYVED